MLMKIALVTFQRAINHGAALQMYALYTALKKMGCQVKIIDYIPDYPNYPGGLKQKIANILNQKNDRKKEKKYEEFRRQLIGDDMTAPITYDRLSEIENDFDSFIAGSDQIWNYHCGHFDKYYFLDFLRDDSKKHTYAVSFNLKSIPKDKTEEYTRRISPFRQISVRETDGAEAVKALTGKDAVIHVDPTLLLTKDEWEAILPKAPDEKYIAIYTLGKPVKLVEKARELAKATGCKIYYLSDFFSNLDLKHVRGLGPLEFLSFLDNAEYVFTNSFHGTAFSVNLHKNFFCEFTTQSKYNFRAEALIKRCNLLDRAVDNAEDVIEISKNAINWNEVEMILNEERSRSQKYLSEILNGSESFE